MSGLASSASNSSRTRFSKAIAQSYGSTVCLPHAYGVEFVDEVSAPDDQNPHLAEGRYALADLVVERRRLRLVDAKL
jgi:hypothetical protein